MTPTEWRQKHPRCRFCKHADRAYNGKFEVAFCKVKLTNKYCELPRYGCKLNGLYEVKA